MPTVLEKIDEIQSQIVSKQARLNEIEIAFPKVLASLSDYNGCNVQYIEGPVPAQVTIPLCKSYWNTLNNWSKEKRDINLEIPALESQIETLKKSPEFETAISNRRTRNAVIAFVVGAVIVTTLFIVYKKYR